MPTQRERNTAFFKAKLPELLQDKLFRHKFVVISREQIQGVFDTFENALREATQKYSGDEFVIQQVVDDKETVNFLLSAS